MPYLAMYRRWRPERFADVVGQPHVVRTLQNALKAGRFTHAYLFAGPRGTGKTSVARLFARAVNCERGSLPEPCNECATCRAIMSGQCLDLLEIDAASNRGIDEIRGLREKVAYLPAQARYKVYIIDEAHMLTSEAFNALLKTLEEPPPHSLIILATTEPQRIPPTVSSRCQRLDFRRVGIDDAVKRLQEVASAMKIQVEPNALEIIAKAAEGSLRDALGILEQCATVCPAVIRSSDVEEILGIVPTELFLELTRLYILGDVRGTFSLVSTAMESGKEPHQFVQDWIRFCRDLMVLKFAPGPLDSANPSLTELALKLDEREIAALLNGLLEIDSQLRFADQPRVIVEVGAIRLLGDNLNGRQRPQPLMPRSDTQTRPAEKPSPLRGQEQSSSVRNGAARQTSHEFGLKEVQQAWPKVKTEAVKMHKPLSALLRDVHPVSVERGQVTLVVRDELKRRLVAREQNKNILESAFRRILEVDVGISFSSEDRLEPVSSAARATPTDSSPASPPVSQLQEDIIGVALEIFGGEIIEKRGDGSGGIREHGENAQAGPETPGRHEQAPGGAKGKNGGGDIRWGDG